MNYLYMVFWRNPCPGACNWRFKYFAGEGPCHTTQHSSRRVVSQEYSCSSDRFMIDLIRRICALLNHFNASWNSKWAPLTAQNIVNSFVPGDKVSKMSRLFRKNMVWRQYFYENSIIVNHFVEIWSSTQVRKNRLWQLVQGTGSHGSVKHGGSVNGRWCEGVGIIKMSDNWDDYKRATWSCDRLFMASARFDFKSLNLL